MGPLPLQFPIFVLFLGYGNAFLASVASQVLVTGCAGNQTITAYCKFCLYRHGYVGCEGAEEIVYAINCGAHDNSIAMDCM
jgi:hypothetical protein